MGSGEHKRPQRSTKRLEADQLANLTRKATATVPPPVQRKVPTTPPRPSGPTMARAMTLEDPLTTQLLAEVARRAETRDFNDDVIDEALQAVDAIDRSTIRTPTRVTHPHTTKRKRKG
jgi:hypothetical protein